MPNEFNIKNGFISNAYSLVKGVLNISGNTTSTGEIRGLTLRSTQSSGDEGGQLDLSTPQTNSTISGGTVSIDIYQNKIRFFESGGSNRGAYIDLTSASVGVGSNLLSGGGGETNTASNLGSGTGLFAQKSGVDLQFKSLTSTGGTINISNNATTVNIEATSTGGGGTFTGGTVPGPTIFTGGLSTFTNSTTWISGATSTDLVRITQAGNGRAFVVEDSTNPDSTPFQINNQGQVGVGLNLIISVYKSASTVNALLEVDTTFSSGLSYGIYQGGPFVSWPSTGILGNGITYGGDFNSESTGVKGTASSDYGTNTVGGNFTSYAGGGGAVGVYAIASGGNSTGLNSSVSGGGIGVVSSVDSGYSIQLLDGTQGFGKFLYSATADGKALWTNNLSGQSFTITTTPTNNNNNTQILTRNSTTGRVEYVDGNGPVGAYNYGMAYTMLTGNYMI